MSRKLLLVLMLAAVAVQGCSKQTRSDLKEVGYDAERDIKGAARDVQDRVEDATD